MDPKKLAEEILNQLFETEELVEAKETEEGEEEEQKPMEVNIMGSDDNVDVKGEDEDE